MEASGQEGPRNVDVMDLKCGQDVQESKWCDLPKDVLLTIVQFLSLKADLPRLRGVCVSWRSLLPDPNHIPVSSPIQCPQLPNQPSLSLVQSRFFLLYPPNTEAGGADSITPSAAAPTRWLVRTAESEPTKWYLLNPLNIQGLFMTFPAIRGAINLCDCRVLDLSTAYSLVSGLMDKAKVLSEKVVALTKFDTGVAFRIMVVALFDGRLVSWRTGDEEWIGVGDSNCKFLDVASHHGKFFAYELSTQKLVVIDPMTSIATRSPSTNFISSPPLLSEHLDRNNVNGLFLVSASDGYLYLLIRVRRPVSKSFTMVVFRLNEEEPLGNCDVNNIWEVVESLGDQIFFVGTDVAFSLPSSVEHLPQWKPGSICLFAKPAPLIVNNMKYFMPKGAECLRVVNCAEYFRYFEMFDMEKEEMISFQELSKQTYTGIFFPPPAWVKWHCPGRGNAQVRLNNLQYRCDEDDDDFVVDDDVESDLDEEAWEWDEFEYEV